jgi:hypothetical protein
MSRLTHVCDSHTPTTIIKKEDACCHVTQSQPVSQSWQAACNDGDSVPNDITQVTYEHLNGKLFIHEKIRICSVHDGHLSVESESNAFLTRSVSFFCMTIHNTFFVYSNSFIANTSVAL